MRTIRYYIAGALVLLSLVGVLSMAYSYGLIGMGTTKAAPLSLGNVAQATPFPSGQRLAPGNDDGATGTTAQTGSSAIQSTIIGAGPDKPAFTVADVRKFLAQYGGGFGKIGVERGTPQVADIEFLTAAALQQKRGEPLNLQRADQALLCYVEYSGYFFVQSDMGVKYYYNHVANVFDAHTGNFLMQTAFNGK